MNRAIKIEISRRHFRCLEPKVYPTRKLVKLRYTDCVECKHAPKCCINSDRLGHAMIGGSAS